MAIKAKITNENEETNSAEFTMRTDPAEQIIHINIRLTTVPARDSMNGKRARYEELTATLEEVIWLRNALNESIREVVGL